MSVDVRSMSQDEYMSKLVHPMLNEALEVVNFNIILAYLTHNLNGWNYLTLRAIEGIKNIG